MRTPAVVLFLLLIVSWILAVRSQPKRPSQSELLRRDATILATRMRRRLERSRLHRDLGDPTLTVLDDCSNSWSKIHETLGSTIWRAADIPAHYSALRTQILSAADLAMDETLLLFQNLVPDGKGSHIPIGVFIEEAVFGAKAGPLPPGFDKARETADRLRQLATEVASVHREAVQELGHVYDTGSARAIDLCIGDLKEIQHAQDELRQNLGGPG